MLLLALCVCACVSHPAFSLSEFFENRTLVYLRSAFYGDYAMALNRANSICIGGHILLIDPGTNHCRNKRLASQKSIMTAHELDNGVFSAGSGHDCRGPPSFLTTHAAAIAAGKVELIASEYVSASVVAVLYLLLAMPYTTAPLRRLT